MKFRDQIIMRQEKTTVKLPYDPCPYTVTGIKGAQITCQQGGKEKFILKHLIYTRCTPENMSPLLERMVGNLFGRIKFYEILNQTNFQILY